jgi:hypothetical protein
VDQVEVKEIPSSSAAPGVGASHQITYTLHGSGHLRFYYFLKTPECRPFVRVKDDELVKKMHENAKKLEIGGLISFEAGQGTDQGKYHLQRTSHDVFTITSLR